MERTGDGLVKICAFLQSVGGPYKQISRLCAESIAYSLASGQYVIGYDDEKILYFSAYWRVEYDAINDLKAYKRPDNILEGPLVYIVEMGSTVGMRPVAEALHQHNPDADAVLFHRRGVFRQFRLQRRRDVS